MKLSHEHKALTKSMAYSMKTGSFRGADKFKAKKVDKKKEMAHKMHYDGSDMGGKSHYSGKHYKH